jgi:hypothetical protein
MPKVKTVHRVVPLPDPLGGLRINRLMNKKSGFDDLLKAVSEDRPLSPSDPDMPPPDLAQPIEPLHPVEPSSPYKDCHSPFESLFDDILIDKLTSSCSLPVSVKVVFSIGPAHHAFSFCGETDKHVVVQRAMQRLLQDLIEHETAEFGLKFNEE